MPLPAPDEEGDLVDPPDWNAAWATATAQALGITLEDDHGFVIRFMRAWRDEPQVAPDARHAVRHLGPRQPGRGRQRLFELFPYGDVAQACRIAGVKRLRAWSTG